MEAFAAVHVTVDITPCFPRVPVHDYGSGPVNRLSGHTSLAAGDLRIIVGHNTPYQG